MFIIREGWHSGVCDIDMAPFAWDFYYLFKIPAVVGCFLFCFVLFCFVLFCLILSFMYENA